MTWHLSFLAVLRWGESTLLSPCCGTWEDNGQTVLFLQPAVGTDGFSRSVAALLHWAHLGNVPLVNAQCKWDWWGFIAEILYCSYSVRTNLPELHSEFIFNHPSHFNYKTNTELLFKKQIKTPTSHMLMAFYNVWVHPEISHCCKRFCIFCYCCYQLPVAKFAAGRVLLPYYLAQEKKNKRDLHEFVKCFSCFYNQHLHVWYWFKECKAQMFYLGSSYTP